MKNAQKFIHTVLYIYIYIIYISTKYLLYILFYSRIYTRLDKLLSEILAALGIMGDQLRAPLQPLNTVVLCCTGVFRDALN